MKFNVVLIEYVILAIILGAQFFIFYQTWSRIQIFKSIIPNSGYNLDKVVVPEHYSNNPDYILENKERFSIFNKDENPLNRLVKKNVTINFISLNTFNPIGLKIEKSINHYLIRNYQASTDFNLLKDIVERNINSTEENISQSVSIPLYLGLMGTMIGIVIGLFNMPEMGIKPDELSQDLDQGIKNLISGVKIAMIASFVGLFLTVLNSAWLFKTAKRETEDLKNDFYTFIQVNLLPTINNGMASTFESLQRNLIRFNEEFGSNLGDLRDVFSSSKENIREQANLIKTIENTKLSEIVRFNVTVLKQLDKSVKEFEKFNQSMTYVNEFVNNSQLIVGKTNELLSRTDNFNAIAENLTSRLDESERLLQFLNRIFTDLEGLKTTTTSSIAEVSFSVRDVFNELQTQIQNLSRDVTTFTVKEAEILKDALSSGSNFKQLDYLSIIENEFSSFKTQSIEQNKEIKNSVDSLNNNILKLIKAIQKGNGNVPSLPKQNIFTKARKYTTSLFSNKEPKKEQ